MSEYILNPNTTLYKVVSFLSITAMFLWTLSAFLPSTNAAAFNDAATGNWNIGTTWGGACASSCTEGTDYPGASDTATIDSHTVTLTGTGNVSTITISGGTFEMGSNTLNVDLDWVYSSGTFTPGTGAVTFNGTVDQDITSGGASFNNVTLNNTGSGANDDIHLIDDIDINGDLTLTDGQLHLDTNGRDVYIAGDFTKNGASSVQQGNGKLIFDGSGTQTVGGSSLPILSDIVINGSSNTLLLSRDASVTSIMVYPGSTLDMGTGGNTLTYSLTPSSTPLNIKGTFIARNSFVNFSNIISDTTIPSVTFNKFQIDTFLAGDYTITLDGPFNASSTAWFSEGTLDAAGYTITMDDWLAMDGSFTNGGDLKFSSTTGTTILFNGDNKFKNVTFNDNGGSATYQINTKVNASSTFNIIGGTVNANGSTITVDGNFTNSDTFTHGSGTLKFASTTGTTAITSGGSALNKVVFNDNGGSATYQLADQLSASSTITVTGGTLDANGQTIVADSDFTNSDTFTHGSGTLKFASTTGTTAITSGGSPFNAITLNDNGGSATYQLADLLSASSTITIAGGTLDANGQTIVLDGNFTNSDTFTHGSGLVKFTGTADQTVTSGGTSFNNVVIQNTSSNGGTDDIAPQDALDINGNLTIIDGDLTPVAQNITLGGNLTIGGGVAVGQGPLLSDGTGTLTFDGSGTQTYTDNTGSISLGDVLVSGTTNTFALGSNATTSYLHIHSGETFTPGSYTLYLNNGSGTTTPFDIDGTFTPGTSNIVYKSSTASTVEPQVYYNLEGQAGAGVALSTSASTTVKNNLTNTTGVIRVNTATTTISGSITNASTIIEESAGLISKQAASLSFNSAGYDTGDTITITLVDEDENLVGTTTDTTTVTVNFGSDSESVTLTESGNATETFTGTLTISQGLAIVGDGVLQVDVDGTITGFYTDNEDSSDSALTTTATVSIPATTDTSTTGGGGGGGGGGPPSLFGQVTNFFIDLFDGGKESDVVSEPEIIIAPEIETSETPTLINRITGVVDRIFSRTETLEPDVVPTIDELAALPKNLRLLLNKFPNLGETFRDVGILKVEDLARLENITFSLPTFTELSRIPTEIVFALAGNDLIDFNLALRINDLGIAEQQISSVAGQPLSLAVRPDYLVDEVNGYIVLREGRRNAQEFPLDLQLAGAIFSSQDAPNKVVLTEPNHIQEEFLIHSFEYSDLDGDGIFTAEVPTPAVSGTYEIITVIDYTDDNYGIRELRLTLLVDPEGYIFEQLNGKELRIPDATVTIFWQNPDSNEFEIWPAKKYQQFNPQTTDKTGEYSFLVPPGSYRLEVIADGYKPFEGEEFQVVAGRGVHENIELVPVQTFRRFIFSPLGISIIIFIILVIIMLFKSFKKIKSA